MDAAGVEGDVAATVSGVAPVTLIAQISVALIAVAVTAVYILKHLPDPGENPGPNSGAGRRDSPRQDAPRLVTSDGNAQERSTREAGGAVDDADGRASTGQGSGEDRGSVTRPSTSSSRGEYRAIISHDEYQDLCSSPPEEKPRSALKKGSLSGQSKEWPTSLESIDEEDEEEEDAKTERGNQRNEDEPKPKESPKRGSRVPSWYYSRSSSGIPSLSKDRDLDTQFDQLATQSFVGHQRPSENVMYSYQDISHVDDARKRAITGFSGTPIGVLQRKPWPQHQAMPSLNSHEYSSTGQTYSQSQAMESDHAKIARMNFMLKGRANSFGNSATQDYENGMPVPDIHIHEPNINELSATCGVDGDDSRAEIGSPVWVETLASTVLLPEKCQEELKAEVVQVYVDEEDEGGEREEVPAEELRSTVRPRPIPRPRTSLDGVSRTPQGTTSPPSTSVSAPPLLTNGPSWDSDGMWKPTADIDRPPAKERAPNTGAEQPLTNANEGLHQQTKHGDLGDIKTDAALQLGLQTRTGFIKKENIDSADNVHNGLPSVARYDDKARVTITPDSRVFTVVGCTPGPIGSFHAEGDSNGKVVEDVEINSTPDSDIIVTPPDNRGTPGGDPVSRDQPVTRRSPYEFGTPVLSTGLSSDEGDLQQDRRAQIVIRQEENTQSDQSSKEHDTSCVAVEPLTAGNESDFIHPTTLHVNSTEPNSTDADNSGNDENTDFPRTADRENQHADLDEIRATLTHKLPLKRPKELQLDESSTSRDFKPANSLKGSNGTSVYPHQDPSDSELSSATSPSEVIAQQRARIQRSLEKLNVPDWFKKSNHYKRVVSGDQNRDQNSDCQSESEPRMTRSPSSCLSDCWSVKSSEEATNPPAVSTKLAFQSEARYRRDFPKRLLYEPIRNAFSCAELPTQSSTGFTEGDAPNHTSVIDDTEISHSADDTLSGQALNQTSSLNDVNSGSPPSQSSPSHGLRMRSKSEGDNLDQITYFDSLAVKRLERHMYDSVFFVTGYINDSVDNLDDDHSDKNSLFASGSIPDESIDDMEYRRQMYELRKSFERDCVVPDLQQRQTDLKSDNLVNENGHMNGGLDTYSVPNNRELESKYSSTTMGSMSTSSPFTTGLYDDHQESRSMKNQTQWTPTPAPRRNIGEEGYSPRLALTEAYPAEELKPDPRYNPDGSRNVKLSPRFAMVAPRTDRERDSPEISPRNTSPRRTTVRIMVTDTSLEDDDSGQSAGHRSDQDPVSASSSDQETVVDGTTNTWTPLDLDKLKDSEFAAVLSVITSRHMKPGNRSALYLPGSRFIPPKEVTMEEIIDSLLGLPYQRATSAIDLNNSGYRGSSSTSTPLTCSTPDLSSSLSPSRGSTPVSSSDKSHSADSLYSDDGNVLNSIIVGRRRNYEGGYHDDSFEEGGSDAIGDEIIMVKCSYKKCAKTKELDQARKSFKTCHNCYTYYCSRQCRKLHWPRHKKRCLFSRVNSACKHVIYHSRYNGQLQSDLTRVARTGYLSRGRGAILLIFPDTESAENYTGRGFDALPSAPTYSTVRELETSSLFGDHMKYLLEMCRSYDPERKFVLNVAIMANAEENRGNRPRRTDMAVKKCAKLSLLASHADPSSKNLDPVPDTLIITSPSGPQGDGELDRKSRQVCFVHIQRQLRQRGVNLRHQHSEIYDKLCRWVEDHEHFTPTTIYPLDERTGKRFMCVLMPEAEPDELGWINNPELLEDIDLDAELEKLENVAGMVVTDL